MPLTPSNCITVAAALIPSLESATPTNAAEERLWSYVSQVADLNDPDTAATLWHTLDLRTVSANTGLPFHTVVKAIDRLKRG